MNQSDPDPKKSIDRFSTSVEQYARYRPGYPSAVIELLQNQCQLPPGAVIADVGAGTGIFTKQLLDNHYHVLAIEPNVQMRAKAEQDLAGYANFVSIDALAQATGLAAQSVDAITVAMAFHWFDKQKTKQEFSRILKPKGICLLVWNLRQSEANDLMRGYEALLRQYGTDYTAVAAENIQDADIESFFHPHSVNIESFANQQTVDEQGFLGRLTSTSYTPKPQQPHYSEMMEAGRQLFHDQKQQGKVNFIYQTKCYYGQLK